MQSLQKAEEARSSLDLALRRRGEQQPGTSADPATGLSSAPLFTQPSTHVVDRTGELEMELKLLRVELAHAQEAQVQATTWHQHSKAMAKASDDACAAFQVRHACAIRHCAC